jgi:hypothetical protein
MQARVFLLYGVGIHLLSRARGETATIERANLNLR